MKCILHIGTEKTASSFLQNWLYVNSVNLSKEGLFLSENAGRRNHRLLPAYFTRKLDEWARHEKIASLHEKDEYFRGFLDAQVREFKTASANHQAVIITSEHCHSRLTSLSEISALHEFLSEHFEEIQVVCYFRNQFDMAVSLYSTALKGGEHKTIRQFFKKVRPENYYYNFLEIASAWAGVFGQENCVFRVYDRKSFLEGDIRKDFISIVKPSINFEKLDFNISAKRNESLSALEAKLYRIINRIIPYWKRGNKGRNDFNKKVRRLVSRVKAVRHGAKIRYGRRQEIEELFHDSNEAFFRTYFNEKNRFRSLVKPEGKA